MALGDSEASGMCARCSGSWAAVSLLWSIGGSSSWSRGYASNRSRRGFSTAPHGAEAVRGTGQVSADAACPHAFGGRPRPHLGESAGGGAEHVDQQAWQVGHRLGLWVAAADGGPWREAHGGRPMEGGPWREAHGGKATRVSISCGKEYLGG
jgi:hypothetical protein